MTAKDNDKSKSNSYVNRNSNSLVGLEAVVMEKRISRLRNSR